MRRARVVVFPSASVLGAVVAALLALLEPSDAHAACNIIPPAEQAFPSTVGSITSPVTLEGNEVEVRLTACDASPGFGPSDVVRITFGAPGPGQPPPVLVSGAALRLGDCAGGGSPCNALRFTMPSTPNLAGPAAIVVTDGATEVARIGPLFQPHELGSTCDKQPENVFQEFTVLPPANRFGDLESGAATQVLATLDASGSLLIPFDYRQVLPLGPGAPVARLLSGRTTVDAFPATPGQQAIDVPTSYVHSYTSDGRPLPPLLRATTAGNEIFGATDGALAFIRVDKTGAEGVKFDLASRRTNGGFGPIVFANSEYAVTSQVPIPLNNLHATDVGVAYTRDESLSFEGNLNATSFGTPTGDTDTDDAVVQIVDVASFTSTNTGMAASPTNNPIVGGAAVETGGHVAAFLESESHQANTDLNGDGDSADDVLRAFSLTGTPLTLDASRLGSAFPAISRKPLAIDGPLVYYREPRVRFQGNSGTFGFSAYDVVVSPDGRSFFYSDPGGCGVVVGVLRDAETGRNLRNVFANRSTCGVTDGVSGLAMGPSGILYTAMTGTSSLGAFIVARGSDSIGIGGTPLAETIVKDGLGGVDGLAFVTKLAVTPFTSDGTALTRRASLYALAPGENAITAFDVSVPLVTTLTGPNLVFVQTLRDVPGCNIDAAHGCVSNFQDARDLAVSPDGANVYVALHGSPSVPGSARVKGFLRGTNTPALTLIGDWPDGGAGGPSLAGAIDVVVSPDGRFVYVLADGDDAITTFSRDTTNGTLTFQSAVVNGAGGVQGLNEARSLVITPDGLGVYVTDSSAAVAIFSRNVTTGDLTFEAVRGPARTPIPSVGMTMSPDGEHLYVARGDAGGLIFTRESALHAFDTATHTDRAGLSLAESTLSAVAAGRAAYVQTTILGFNVASLYDAATDTTTMINAAASKIALSSKSIVTAYPESLIGDVDGNGFTNEDALVLLSTSDPGGPTTVVPANAIDIGATDVCEGGTNQGGRCTLDGECPGGSCGGVAVATSVTYLDIDGFSRVRLRVYRALTGFLDTVGENVVDFEVSGNIIAFRAAESGSLISADLNCDGDMNDIVMQAYDLLTNQVVPQCTCPPPPGARPACQATVKCELPGCEPGLPYKIRGDAIYFLTRETDQGNTDLNGDLDANDTVVQIFRVRDQATQVVDTPVGTAGLVPPLPTEFLGQPILYKQALESTLGPDRDGDGLPDGVDVNEDGDTNDVVVLVDGDADNDGVFDTADVCTETPNSSQLDNDGDGLGDACDPSEKCLAFAPGAPPPVTASVLDCQVAVAKGARRLAKIEMAAMRSCLDKIAVGTISGDPTTLCRGKVTGGVIMGGPGGGFLVGGDVTPPANPKTATRIKKAVDKLAADIVDACPGSLPSQLDACDNDAAGLASCLAARAAKLAIALTTDLYGTALESGDPAVERCQKVLGSTGQRYANALLVLMDHCLDKVNAGVVTGDAAAQCLGAWGGAAAVPPAEARASKQFARADGKLDVTIPAKCPAPALIPLDACANDAAGVGSCLRCTAYRQVTDLVGDVYGRP